MTTEQSTAPAPEALTFKAEVQQVLHILAHSLYTDREIFLRELISNASDSLNRMQFEMLTNREVLDPEAELAIRVEADSEAKTITISDSGTGMTSDELVEHLGTIAQSSARAFVQQTQEGNKAAASEIIGQFGVGFYSVFMVADKVTVLSRSFRLEAEAALWESSGDATFQVGPGEREQRGTTITLQLKEDAAEFANSWRLEQIIKRHSDFVAFPIYSGDRQINQQKALWRRAPREVEAEQYQNLYRQLTLDADAPLLQLHLSTDVPVDMHSILFVPAKRERGLIERRIEGKVKLYSRKVLILEEAKDILPNYFRFVEGVVDSEDLPLNVSREAVQSAPVMQRIRKTLTSRLHRELNDLASQDAERFAAFWKEFGVFIKEGIATDYENRNELLKLLRFNSNRSSDELITLEQYKSRIVDGQTEIYYLLASSLEAGCTSPHLDPFTARGIEVLILHDIMDGFMLSGLRDYEGLKLRNVDEANLELPGSAEEAAPQVDDAAFARIAERAKAILGDKVKEVRASKLLRDSPARLVSDDDAMGREMQRIQQMLGREGEAAPRILELNPASGLIASLARRLESDADDTVTTAAIEQLYDNALLIEGLHQNPATMVPRIMKLLEAAARG
ncbi:molecular chaperone HtpG [Candidatus Viridilinea mediisalina]|uniref:Chaperone protein HtpG n=1 Tax=Candidatus Viridilinea mediisalina TaxID=2024553 RepID=A0A2A6RFI7_9CHLR|nr:molecular chaperone HtpG [Candidatus Viridilinea mediisalina]PDW01837.1 molecular chaperone HtpG [Candidatus Viridilinea mediisalina]